VSKRQKKASRAGMTNRIGKKRKKEATYIEIYTAEGKRRVAANRIAKRKELAKHRGAPGRSAIQLVRVKRRTRIIAARRLAVKQQKMSRSESRA
jgi:hypothetical protein